jgi:hypothetical protein
MRVSTKMISLLAWLALVALGADVRADTLYDSQGFELSGGFSTTGAASYDVADPADLYGQGGSNYWGPDQYPPSYGGNGVAADVETTNVASGTQAVALTRLSSSIDTRWSPAAGFNSPYTPVASATPIVNINWDMDIASGGSDCLFGIELNDYGGVGRLAFTAVDASGNLDDDHGGSINGTGVSVTLDQWHHYDLQANFASQTYAVFVDGSSTPADTFAFENLDASEFTDASLVSYSADGGPGTGEAYYDNYVITAVIPEPSGVAGCVLAGVALPLLRRRHRRCSTI